MKANRRRDQVIGWAIRVMLLALPVTLPVVVFGAVWLEVIVVVALMTVILLSIFALWRIATALIDGEEWF